MMDKKDSVSKQEFLEFRVSARQRIFIFGGGAWGLALAHALAKKNDVFILSRRELSGVERFSHCFLNPASYLPDYLKNNSVSTKDSIPSAVDNKFFQLNYADFKNAYKDSKNPLCVFAIASAFLRGFLKEFLSGEIFLGSIKMEQKTINTANTAFLESLKNEMQILIASKGIEQGSGAFVGDIFKEHFRSENLCYLAGPSFAKEVQSELPTAVVIHSSNKILAKRYAACFPYFIKPYVKNDMVGAEIAGAYKNVIAIAGGICDGLKLGNNAKASLLSRGLVEMARFGKFFGAKNKTFLGLSGSGDLFLTSNSSMSRNYRVGLALAQGKNLAQILKEIGEVAEGAYSAKAITQLAIKHSLYTPIATEVQKILEGGSIESSLARLLSKKI